MHYEANPVTAFDRTFGGLAGGTSTAEAPDFESRVLDIADAELADLSSQVQKSPRESAKVNSHRNALDEARNGAGQVPQDYDATPLASVEALRSQLQGNAAAAYQYPLFE